MVGVEFRKKELFISIGGLLVTVGGLLFKFWTHGAALYVAIILSFVGVGLIVHGTFGIAPPAVKILNEWNDELIRKCLREAAPNAKVDILQTSIPGVTQLIGELEKLLIEKSKSFQIRILLLDHENAKEIVVARVALRTEKAEDHKNEICANIDQFIRMKSRVDNAWSKSRSGAKLDLEIRLYTFLPFGSIFQIGTKHIFSGLFWNFTSSINGPMLRIASKACELRRCLEKQFATGWDGASTIYPLAATPVREPHTHTL